MSYRRQRSISLGGRYRQVSLYLVLRHWRVVVYIYQYRQTQLLHQAQSWRLTDLHEHQYFEMQQPPYYDASIRRLSYVCHWKRLVRIQESILAKAYYECALHIGTIITYFIQGRNKTRFLSSGSFKARYMIVSCESQRCKLHNEARTKKLSSIPQGNSCFYFTYFISTSFINPWGCGGTFGSIIFKLIHRILNNAGLLLSEPLANLPIEISEFSYDKMHFKLSAKRLPFCVSINVWPIWTKNKADRITVRHKVG